MTCCKDTATADVTPTSPATEPAAHGCCGGALNAVQEAPDACCASTSTA